MKRSTADVNQANYEKARRILFGDEKWQTAGVFDTTHYRHEQTFTLGPFEYILKGTGGVCIKTPKGVYRCIKITSSYLVCSFPSVYWNLQLEAAADVEKYNRQTFEYVDGVLYYNYEGQTTLSYTGPGNPQSFVKPGEIDKLKHAYKIRKRYGIRDSLVFNWVQGFVEGDANQPFLLYEPTSEFVRYAVSQIPEGLDKRENSSIVISTGSTGMNVFISTIVDPKIVVPYFPTDEPNVFHEFQDGEVWLLSDLKMFSKAVDWLMHVLSPPAPGKDASEPLHRIFRPDKKNRWYYFLMDSKPLTYEQAIDVRTNVMNLLHSQGTFVDNLAKFKVRRVIQDREGNRTTWEEFQEALERIERFNKSEYLGCKS